MSEFVVLIPAYNPDQKLVRVVQSLVDEKVPVVVVDDGSSAEHRTYFDEVSRLDGVKVLRHVVNLGKGAALKMAMNDIAVHHPERAGVVTADADGQHTTADILKVGAALCKERNAIVLGVRSFEGKIPFRSRLGNAVTKQVFNFLTGLKVEDTQTGLRGVPMSFIPNYLGIKRNRYEFELEQLVKTKRFGHRIVQVPIESVYLDDNRGSHFNPLLDSARIYFVLLRFVSSSILAGCLDYIIFMICFGITANIATSQYIARTLSGAFNYSVNRRKVFYSRTPIRNSLPKYILLALFLASCSYFLIRGFVGLGVAVAIAKPVSEAILFVISFGMQRSLVFVRITDDEDGND